MNDISDWVQKNWFELGSLLVQCTILATVAWYGSKVLRFLRAFFQYQDAVRQRLSVANAAGYDSETSGFWHDVIAWLQAPMGSGGQGPFRKAIRWLQAPIGS